MHHKGKYAIFATTFHCAKLVEKYKSQANIN